MKNTICVIIILNFSNWLYAQNKTSVSEYYSSIHQAEISITNLNFDKALHYYKKAFHTKNTPFAIDIYNASLCALQVQEKRKAYKYIGRLIDKGLDSTFFTKEVFAKLRGEQGWQKLMKSYSKRRKQYFTKIDTNLRNELIGLYQQDQKFRTMKGSYKVYGDTIRKIDSINIVRIKQLISRYGYPNENRIGIYENQFTFQPIRILILHNYQNGNNDLTPLLFKEVKNGNMLPREYAYWIETTGKEKQFHNQIFFKLDSTIIVYNPVDSTLLAQINQNRLEIGLETIEEWKRKILFENNERLFLNWDEYFKKNSKTYNDVFFSFLTQFGIIGLPGDKSFTENFVKHIPKDSIINRDVLSKQKIKSLIWSNIRTK